MAPSPAAKRTKVVHEAHASAHTPKLRDYFARSTTTTTAPQHSSYRPAAGSTASSSSVSIDAIARREEDELRWAIAESLKEAEKLEFQRNPDNKDSLLGCNDVQPQTPVIAAEVQTSLQSSADEHDSAKLSTCIIAEQQLHDAQTCQSESNDVAPLCEDVKQEESAAKPLNAFSKLMSTHSEAKEWATADVVEARNYSGAARSRVQYRTAPFYKVLTGMPISVDAFRFGEIEGCTAYFLSHFHADHYGGITSIWGHGPIYCSVTTANLVRSSLRVQDQYVCPLPMNETIVIPRTGGVRVTLLDANHCPGSCVFLFEGPQTCHILPTQPGHAHPALAPPHMTFRYLHCGDFRASPRHANHPLIKGKRLDTIYLDTTYCNPRYCFPAQEMVVNACAEMLHRVVPEQCRRGQLATDGAKLDEEEEWRTSPMKGRKLEAAMKAEEDAKGASALRGWLDGASAATTSTLIRQANTAEGEVCVKEEEDDLSTMEFEDEGLGFVERAVTDNQSEWDSTTAQDEDVDDERSGDAALVKDEALSCAKPEEDEERKATLAAIQEDYPRALVVVGTYTIGKEKIVLACAKALGTRIYCTDARKYRVYAQLEDAELHSLLTRDPLKAYVHVTSLMAIGGDALQEHASKMRSQGMRIDRAIAFRPTGWTYRPPAGMDVVSPSLDRLIQWNQRRTYSPSQMFTTRDSTAQYSIYGVPYSEHSSFFELTAFCLSVDYGRIIATVNVGNPASRAKMARWFDKWKAEKKRRNGEPIESRSKDFF